MIYAVFRFYFIVFSSLLEIDVAWWEHRVLVRRVGSKQAGRWKHCLTEPVNFAETAAFIITERFQAYGPQRKLETYDEFVICTRDTDTLARAMYYSFTISR